MKKKKTPSQQKQSNKFLMFLFFILIAIACYYHSVISEFYRTYSVQLKIITFLVLVFIFLFVPINYRKLYRLTKNINEMDIDGKYDYWLNTRKQAEMIKSAYDLMNESSGGGIQRPTHPSYEREQRNVNGYKKRLIAAKQRWACAHCKNMLDASFEIDHIIPLSDGGTNDDENLVCLCRNCHGIKTFRERA